MGRLLPDSVEVVDALGDLSGPLFPEEEAVVSRSVDKRRREFVTGRLCARRALTRLGVLPAPLLPGPRGEPVWPKGVVGAISHCEGYRVAAVARRTDIASLGIDAEPAARLPHGALEAVSLPEERARLRRYWPADPHIPWDRLLFSAKEAVYKAWFPLTGRTLEFEDALIVFDHGRRTFFARLLVPAPPPLGGPGGGFTGRWAVHSGLVMTAVTVPASSLDGGRGVPEALEDAASLPG
ncbi:4'-phosphopantetheinyl transferase [Wenjunlia tyrosinilytica]|uniref:4'-phosphopantetheinyl transferase n=2 Tax=Wenjunlia tyrosinilytica TaxID=1544741 RepID=A0A917ZXM4_9ACTN|nr:4'-phosphopantetheinyl transferase [Wenjunlia tyrosinilytica]